MSLDAWLVLAVATMLVLGFARALSRATDVCTARVEAGRLRVVRGRCPARLREDLESVVRRARVQRAVFTIARQNGRGAVVRARGLDEETLQRLRNVAGSWPAARLGG